VAVVHVVTGILLVFGEFLRDAQMPAIAQEPERGAGGGISRLAPAAVMGGLRSLPSMTTTLVSTVSRWSSLLACRPCPIIASRARGVSIQSRGLAPNSERSRKAEPWTLRIIYAIIELGLTQFLRIVIQVG